ncbi:MAG: hypothetical protein HKO57_12890 [Akkermansiaceae bacterium]|nr:hypothetical protein [Akkermansiaceae bacterium]
MRKWVHAGSRALATAALGLAEAACGTDRRESPDTAGTEGPAPAAPGVQVVGEVASVHTSEGFVLIRRTGRRSLPTTLAYFSVAKDGRTASLRLTGERLGRFFAADIQDGQPVAGDLVVARGVLPESTPAVTPAGPMRPQNRPAGLPDAIRRSN